jgi:hypothetical protein
MRNISLLIAVLSLSHCNNSISKQIFLYVAVEPPILGPFTGMSVDTNLGLFDSNI